MSGRRDGAPFSREASSYHPTTTRNALTSFGDWAWLPAATLTTAGAVLVWSVAPGQQLYDSGELARAALELGGSHPPGQPLHALVAHAFMWLPLGPLPMRLGLLSVACALGAAWLLGSLTAHVGKAVELANARVLHIARAAAILGTLTLPPVLRQTLRIEVYTLALLLFAASAHQLFLWARQARSTHLRAAAVCAGLAALVHPPHAFAAALTGLCIALAQPRRLLSPRAALSAAISGGLPLVALIYLPLRAHAGASMWGDPQSLDGFWEYVSGRAFMRNIASHNRLVLLRDYGEYALHLTAGVPLIGALFALRYAAQLRDRSIFGLLAACVATLTAACLQPLEAHNPDNVAYLAPALGLWLAVGVAGCARLATAPGFRRVVAAFALVLLALAPTSASDLKEYLQADVPALDSLAAWSTDSPPPRALVVVTLDFTATSWMMARSVEGARPDVAFFAFGLATSSWHWQQLRHHPAFDGQPVAAGSGENHERYTRGAILRAVPHVPVLLERELPGLTPSALAGPYFRVDRGPVTTAPDRDDRALRRIAQEASHDSPGDSGAAGAVVREAVCQRALRLFRAGELARAFAAAALALWELPAAEREAVQTTATLPAPQLPFIVNDPRSYLTSTEDAARQAAAMLWAVSDRPAASRLLEHQFDRGDPLALLQLAHLQASVGQRDDARQTLTALQPLVSDPSPDLSQLIHALAH